MSRYVFYIMLTLSLASLPFVARADQSPAGQEGKAAAQSLNKEPTSVEYPNISLGSSSPSTIKKNNKRRK